MIARNVARSDGDGITFGAGSRPRAPAVFISSVVSTLERERETACKLIESLGWTCDASGLREARFWGWSEEGCYRAVERSDLYIGIFCSRSGSPSFLNEAFITEMEFYTALNSRRPMRIYVLERPGAPPDHNLRHFIECVKAEFFVRTCSTIKQFEEYLLKDLEEFQLAWLRGNTDPLVPPMYLDQALKHMDLFVDEAELFNLNINSQIGDSSGLIETYLHKMENFYRDNQFAAAADVGANLMLMFRSLGLSYHTKEMVLLWARFLQIWAGSCIWSGYVSGRFGALNSSLLMREAYRMLGNWERFHEANGLIANAYYVLASRIHVREARLGNVKTFIDLIPQQQSALNRALVFDEIRTLKHVELFPHLHRAYVNLELGDYQKAIRDFRTMLGYGDMIEERMYLDYLTGLGQAMVFDGLNKELQVTIKDGVRLLHEAKAGLEKFFDSPYYLSYMKRIAKGFIRTGEREMARAILKELYPLAIQRKLGHQAEGIGALITSLSTQNRNPLRQ